MTAESDPRRGYEIFEHNPEHKYALRFLRRLSMVSRRASSSLGAETSLA